MAIMHPAIRNEFSRDLGLVQAAVRAGVVEQRSNTADRQWQLWLDFCATLSVDPWFREGHDPVPYLQVFAARYRDGRIAPRGKPVRSGTVEGALRSIGQTYKGVGAPDIRLDSHGNVDFRLGRQLRSYTKEDPAPHRVKPVPIQVVRMIVSQAYGAPQAEDGFRAIADMTCIGFFFLCRSGEHTKNPTNTPFTAADVRIYIGNRLLLWRVAATADLLAATSARLIFTTQKSCVKGETVGHGLSGNALTCPVLALVRRLLYIRNHNMSDDTPLCTYRDVHNKTRYVTSNNVTVALRAALALVDPATVDIQPHEIEARSLRAGGASALMAAGIDQNTIQLLGRWHSDAMLRYLHVQALPIIQRLAARMFNQGSISFAPGLLVPALPP